MAEWVKVQEFATRFEAEIARARVESANIPATIKSHEGGLFGAGFQGAVTSGVDLYVPSARLADARALLDPDREAQT